MPVLGQYRITSRAITHPLQHQYSNSPRKYHLILLTVSQVCTFWTNHALRSNQLCISNQDPCSKSYVVNLQSMESWNLELQILLQESFNRALRYLHLQKANSRRPWRKGWFRCSKCPRMLVCIFCLQPFQVPHSKGTHKLFLKVHFQKRRLRAQSLQF